MEAYGNVHTSFSEIIVLHFRTCLEAVEIYKNRRFPDFVKALKGVLTICFPAAVATGDEIVIVPLPFAELLNQWRHLSVGSFGLTPPD